MNTIKNKQLKSENKTINRQPRGPIKPILAATNDPQLATQSSQTWWYAYCDKMTALLSVYK